MNLKRSFTPFTTTILLMVLTALPAAATSPDTENSVPSIRTAAAQTAKNAKTADAAKAKKAAPYKVTQKDLDDALKILDEAVLTVKTEAREKAKPAKIANGAIDAMTLFIETRKLDSSFFNAVDGDADAVQANKQLKEQFLAAAKRYPHLMQDHKLTMAALKGIMRGTDDPYTVYMTPEEYKLLNEQMSGGNFGGIGIVMEFKNRDEASHNPGVLSISKVMPDTPAGKAGLIAKDEITHVDGKPTYGLSLTDCSKLLRGEVNSKVVLTIRRPSSGHSFDVTLTREIIKVETARHEILEKDGIKIGYIYLGIFGETTNDDVEKALRALEAEKCRAYIIDVRENSGGYVSAAVDVCSKFLPTGSRVVSIVDGADKEQIIYSHPSLRTSDIPLAVLIDANSASASEITAGAMKDHSRAKLVGVKSFGKGSVQKLFAKQFPPGKISAFKITTAHYHTPSGHDIHKAGLQPDEEVKMEPELMLEKEKDTQLQKTLELLAAQVKETDKKAVKPAEDKEFISVCSFKDELQYLDEKFKDSTYTIEDRALTEDDGNIIETITVKDSAGKISSFKFNLKPAADK